MNFYLKKVLLLVIVFSFSFEFLQAQQIGCGISDGVFFITENPLAPQNGPWDPGLVPYDNEDTFVGIIGDTLYAHYTGGASSSEGTDHYTYFNGEKINYGFSNIPVSENGTLKVYMGCAVGGSLTEKMFFNFEYDSITLSDHFLAESEISEEPEIELSVFYNPQLKAISIQLDNASQHYADLYNMQGKKVKSARLDRNNNHIYNLDSGAYILIIRQNNENLFSQKVVIF